MNDISDSEIIRLIEQGKAIIQQEEAQRLAKEQAKEAEIRAAWEKVTDELRARLPIELQPYMQPVNDSYPPFVVNYHDVVIEVPGLAPVRAKIYTRQEEGIVYQLPEYYNFDSFEDEPPRIEWFFRPQQYSRLISSLAIALAGARNLCIEANQKLNDCNLSHHQPEPVYAPVDDDPIFKSTSDRLYDLVREIVNQVIAERG